MLEGSPCNSERECQLRDTIGCYEDLHHEAFPRALFLGIGVVGIVFRELPENKVRGCRQLHNDEHALGIPEVPSEQLMLLAIIEALNTGQIRLSTKKKKRLMPKIERVLDS